MRGWSNNHFFINRIVEASAYAAGVFLVGVRVFRGSSSFLFLYNTKTEFFFGRKNHERYHLLWTNCWFLKRGRGFCLSEPSLPPPPPFQRRMERTKTNNHLKTAHTTIEKRCSNIILFASRYPTSPSEGSLLYGYVEEGGQTKEKLENMKTRNGHNSTCKPPFRSSDRQTKALDEICLFRGRGVEARVEGRGRVRPQTGP